ncbi:hypothetical protein [Rhodococcus sp. SORGH_AS_0301]|uniref:hypothetical protein n=1 Tax=Rhodococcus sp. SORGH_AS_0301 TaxID=3041780 RepID=UPI002788E49D|nr:hypothetical protein [Rhodococcus sp. SORGH_AS_0301]MDQ1181853.1 hypothetical protein [Rhodococcus sp. SORGH_AS_0301]
MLLVEPAYTSTGFEASSLPPDSPLPVYAVQREIAREVLAAALRDADDPSVVAKIVVKAATDTQPTLRYTAGSMAKRVSILRRFAPARIFDRQIRKLNQLTAHPAEPPVASQTLMARRGGTEPSAGKSRSTTTPKG